MLLAVFVVQALSFSTTLGSHHTEENDSPQKHQTGSKAAMQRTVLSARSSSPQEVKVGMEEPLNRNAQLVPNHVQVKSAGKVFVPEGNFTKTWIGFKINYCSGKVLVCLFDKANSCEAPLSSCTARLSVCNGQRGRK